MTTAHSTETHLQEYKEDPEEVDSSFYKIAFYLQDHMVDSEDRSTIVLLSTVIHLQNYMMDLTGCRRILQNISTWLRNYLVSQHRRVWPELLLIWEPQMQIQYNS
jgi:hypothetical protein